MISMQSSEDLKIKIQSLESERSRLRGELENLRKAAAARVAALEGDVATMREEVTELREFLGSAAVSQPLPAQVNPVTQVNPIPQSAVAAPAKEPNLSSASPMDSQSAPDPIIEKLSEEEYRVIEVLRAHNGKYQQKNIRVDAKLSWLQSNRVISHLAELGVVSLEKNGPIENVVLAEEMKK
jgi:uncharacterized membrane protein